VTTSRSHRTTIRRTIAAVIFAHAFDDRWAVGGVVPATVVQDLLGHASLSSTQVYTKAAARHVRAAANALPVRHLMHPPDR